MPWLVGSSRRREFCVLERWPTTKLAKRRLLSTTPSWRTWWETNICCTKNAMLTFGRLIHRCTPSRLRNWKRASGFLLMPKISNWSLSGSTRLSGLTWSAERTASSARNSKSPMSTVSTSSRWTTLASATRSSIVPHRYASRLFNFIVGSFPNSFYFGSSGVGPAIGAHSVRAVHCQCVPVLCQRS